MAQRSTHARTRQFRYNQRIDSHNENPIMLLRTLIQRTPAPLILVQCVLAAALLIAPDTARSACQAAEHRQFDFWIGDWDVFGPDGTVVGRNRIEADYDGCVLREHYDTGRGYRGGSLNAYDAGRQVWHQTWIDSTGTLLRLEGGLRDGVMTLEGETIGADGGRTAHRIEWRRQDDGSVRQTWQQRTGEHTGEQDWRIAFDGVYRRHALP